MSWVVTSTIACLEQEQISQDCFLPLQEMRQLGQSTLTEDGQRASALRFGDRRTMAVLAALACQAYIPTEIGNRTLRPVVAQLLASRADYLFQRPNDL